MHGCVFPGLRRMARMVRRLVVRPWLLVVSRRVLLDARWLRVVRALLYVLRFWFLVSGPMPKEMRSVLAQERKHLRISLLSRSLGRASKIRPWSSP